MAQVAVGIQRKIGLFARNIQGLHQKGSELQSLQLADISTKDVGDISAKDVGDISAKDVWLGLV